MGGGIFKRHWWRYYGRIPLSEDEVRQSALPNIGEFDRTVMSFDLTFSDKKTSDFVGGMVLSKRGAQTFVRDYCRERLSFSATKELMRRWHLKYPEASAKYVEDAANAQAVCDDLKYEIPGIILVPTGGGKVPRAHVASPFVEAGNIFLPDPSIAPWVDAFVNTCSSFPAVPNDDDDDAFTHGIVQLYAGKNTGVFDYYAQKAAEAEEKLKLLKPATLSPRNLDQFNGFG